MLIVIWIAVIIEHLLNAGHFIFMISVFTLGPNIAKIVSMLQNWVLRVRVVINIH